MTDDNRDEMPPWLQPVDEAGAMDDDGVFSGTMKKFVIGFAVIVLALFGLSMWMLYDRPADELDEPIYIAAPKTAVKEKPDDPGGMEVPHQDKEVYNRVSGDNGDGETTLRDGAETPVSTLEDSREAVEETQTPTPAPVKEDPAPQPATVSGQLVQVGAFGSRTSAEKAWVDMVSKYPENFAGLTPVFQALERDGKTLVRLRAGSFNDRAAADQFCQALKDKGLGCLVVSQ